MLLHAPSDSAAAAAEQLTLRTAVSALSGLSPRAQPGKAIHELLVTRRGKESCKEIVQHKKSTRRKS